MKPRGDKRQRTRASLLEAARSLIREKGYEHTTMEDIAERAGMTTGAIYGNFANREDLFVALGQAYWKPIRPKVAAGASFAEVMSALAEATIAVLPDRADAAIGRLTGMAYALRHEALRKKVAEVTAESYAFGAEWLREVIRPEEMPMPADQLVRVIHALSEGLIFQRLQTPELVPDEVIRAAFAAISSSSSSKA
jgi:AcrR family transcriptional regulator